MLDAVNSTQNVTVAHLERSQYAVGEAIPNLDHVIDEALVFQKIPELRAKFGAMPLPPAATVAGSAATVAGSAAAVAGSAAMSPPAPAPAPPPLQAGEFLFGTDVGVIVAPPPGTDAATAPIVLLVPPSGGFHRLGKRAGGGLELPLCCPKPCWYAYMQWDRGKYKETLPPQFLEFIRFIRVGARGNAIIGWGFSRGGKWLMEIVREHVGLLHAAVMFAGYPQARSQYDIAPFAWCTSRQMTSVA